MSVLIFTPLKQASGKISNALLMKKKTTNKQRKTKQKSTEFQENPA